MITEMAGGSNAMAVLSGERDQLKQQMEAQMTHSTEQMSVATAANEEL